jgi:hypothetical protein
MENPETLSHLLFWAGLIANTLLCGLALAKSLKTAGNTTTDILTLILIGGFSGGFLTCLWLACTLLTPAQNHLTACFLAWLLTGVGPTATYLCLKHLTILPKK